MPFLDILGGYVSSLEGIYVIFVPPFNNLKLQHLTHLLSKHFFVLNPSRFAPQRPIGKRWFFGGIPHEKYKFWAT